MVRDTLIATYTLELVTFDQANRTDADNHLILVRNSLTSEYPISLLLNTILFI